jgi:hypothetical protein
VTFVENSVEVFGGGMRCDGSSATLSGAVFNSNSANDHGGGMTCSGQSSALVLADCFFGENTAFSGAGLSCFEGSAMITRTTFAGNAAEHAGGAVLCFGANTHSFVSCTMFGNSAAMGGGVWSTRGVSVDLAGTIIAFSASGEAVQCDDGGVAALTCCDVYGNPGGDWVGCISGQAGVNGNISEDPLFCDPENGDFTLREDSPCAPFAPPNEECDLVGAWPVGCGSPTTSRRTTWGAIKSAYRE